MRVFLVGNTVPPEKAGGLPRYVRELASALAGAGCEVLVLAKRVAPNAPRVEQCPDGVQIIRHSAPSKGNPLFALAYPLCSAYGVLSPLRSRDRESVIHAHFPATALPLALAGVGFLYTFHAPMWRELLDERQNTYALPAALQPAAVFGVRGVERLVVSRASTTFVLSEFMRAQLSDLSSGVARRASVIPGGVDIAKFRPDSAVGRAGIQSPLLFTARRLTPRTGVDRLLAAMPHVLRSFPDAALAIAGKGEMEPGLRALAAQLGVSERVSFLGHVSEESLVDWYRRASLVVMPTMRLEGFGLTAAEALACGAPVLGTPVGALPELLAPLAPSLLSADASAQGLAAAIIRLLSDPDGLASIGARARNRVAPTMGWETIARRYLDVYEMTLAKRAPSRAGPRPIPRRGRRR